MQQLSYEQILERVQSILPQIQSRLDITEELRCQPKETINDFIHAGLIRTLMPKRWGGFELPIDSMYKTTSEIAKVDPSAGWCFGLLVLHSWMLASFPEKAQQDVWEENPDACIATSFGSPKSQISSVDGGYSVSGIWAFSSGIDHCNWAMIFAAMEPNKTGDDPKYKMMLVPKSNFEIIDTWHTVAQRGTGSKNIQVKDAFIPAHRTIDMATWCQKGGGPGCEVNKNPLYSYPLYAVIPVALASAVYGASKGAYEIWKEGIKKKSTVRNAKVADFTHQQIRIAEVSAKLEAAQALLEKQLKTLQTSLSIGTYERLRLRRNYGFAVKLCNEAVKTMLDHSGAGSIFETHPLQRYWRDIQGSSMHITFNMDHLGEMFGKVELGLPLGAKDTLLS